MNTFTYSYPVKVYFGEKAAEKNLAAELAKTKEGTFQLQVSGAVLNNEQVEADLVAQLIAMGYKAEALE